MNLLGWWASNQVLGDLSIKIKWGIKAFLKTKNKTQK